MKNKLKIDGFIIALIGAIIVAKILPEPAIYNGTINLSLIIDIGITLIFFFYGLKLNLNNLRQDLSNWKLHLIVQLSSFVLFPLLVLPFYLLLKSGDYYLIALGFFFLASLPSTVSSSVVMVSIAKGNIPSAIFNASISSLIGIFITPLLMTIVISSNMVEINDLSHIIVKLIVQVLLPVVVGLFLNRFFGKWAYKNANFLKLFDQTIILLVVYHSFSESFVQKLFDNSTFMDILLVFIGSMVLFFIAYFIIQKVSIKFKFSREDVITATFSGSKKSLVHGTVMAGIIFEGFSGVGVILLPIMVYHALQLILVSWIAQNKAKQFNPKL